MSGVGIRDAPRCAGDLRSPSSPCVQPALTLTPQRWRLPARASDRPGDSHRPPAICSLRARDLGIALWRVPRGSGRDDRDSGTALANGRDIVAVERALGLFHEVEIQQALSALEGLFSAYYMAGFAPLIAVTLGWLAIRQPQQYRELRTALLISLSIATVVFIVFPAAPPRLIPDLGIIDTVGLSAHDTGSFAGVRFNPYAAMPSMHVGWSLLVGLAGFRAARRRLIRVFFAVHPFVMVLTVTATGNHFALDAVGGAAIAAAVAGLVLSMSRRRSTPATVNPHAN